MNPFLKEITEQPEALKKTLGLYSKPDSGSSLKKIKHIVQEKKFDQIIFTGMGSSNFVSGAASALFNSLAIPAFAVNSSELLHYNTGLFKKSTLLICISQSGESFEIKELLKILPNNVFTIGITNEEQSTLAERADITLYSKAGKEEMTSTKTYVSTTLVSFILGWSLAGKWNDHKIQSVKNMISGFQQDLTNYRSRIDNAINFLDELPALTLIARGPGISTAMQSGLMFKETTKMHAFGISGGEFRHGPMEMVQEDFKSVLFASEGKTLGQSLKMATDIADFGGKVLLITNTDTVPDHKNIHIIKVDEKDEFLFSIRSIIPIQLFIDLYTKRKGYEAGNFSHGAKVTEIE